MQNTASGSVLNDAPPSGHHTLTVPSRTQLPQPQSLTDRPPAASASAADDDRCMGGDDTGGGGSGDDIVSTDSILGMLPVVV